jgi:hypothetical protein
VFTWLAISSQTECDTDLFSLEALIALVDNNSCAGGFSSKAPEVRGQNYTAAFI